MRLLRLAAGWGIKAVGGLLSQYIKSSQFAIERMSSANLFDLQSTTDLSGQEISNLVVVWDGGEIWIQLSLGLSLDEGCSIWTCVSFSPVGWKPNRR